MLLYELMSLQPVVVTPQISTLDAAAKMRDANVGCLVVASADDRVLGVLSDRDIVVRCLAERSTHDLSACTVAQHMTSPAITAQHTLDVLEAAHIMTSHGIKRLPVTERNHLVGIVSSSDVAAAIAGPMSDLLLGMKKTQHTGVAAR